MKKKIYATPHIKVKAVDNDSLMQASGNQTSIGASNDTDTNPDEWAASKKGSIWQNEE